MNNQKIIISGGSRGIGAAAVIKALERGADVAFSSTGKREYEPAIKTALENYSDKLFPFVCDMRNSTEVDKFVDAAYSKLGGLDILIANSGTASHGCFDSYSDCAYRDVIAANLDACFFLNRAAAKYFISQKSGKIINIASVWGICGASCEALYAAAKAAVINLTKSLASELGPSGITANCVCPGVVNTAMLRENLSDQDIKAVAEEIPLGRIAEPAEIADLIIYLALDDKYCSGSVFLADGGFSL